MGRTFDLKMMSLTALRQIVTTGVLALGIVTSLLTFSPRRANAQANTGVLLFPAVVSGDRGEGSQETEEIVTEAIRAQLKKAGVSVVVYSKRLPSILRAISESDRVITEKDAEAGPGDDNRKSQRFAEVVGAAQYITVFVDDFKYNAATRTAQFNLSISRYNTQTGVAAGTFGKMQQGVSPGDVAQTRQIGSATARAAAAGAEEAVTSLFPQSRAVAAPSSKPAKKRRVGDRLTPLFGAVLGILYFSTR